MTKLYIQVSEPTDVYFIIGQSESITGIQITEVNETAKLLIDIRNNRLNSLTEQDYLDYIATLPVVPPVLPGEDIVIPIEPGSEIALAAGLNTIVFEGNIGAIYALVIRCYVDAVEEDNVDYQVTNKTVTGFDITVPIACKLDYTATKI